MLSSINSVVGIQNAPSDQGLHRGILRNGKEADAVFTSVVRLVGLGISVAKANQLVGLNAK